MRYHIKLRIMFKEERPGWNRFKDRTWITLDNFSAIKSEAQLCKFIHDNFGNGRFMCLAYQKGVKSLWCFWIGYIMDNGFIRDLNKNKELDAAKKALFIANQRKVSYDEREIIQEDLDLEREIANEGGGKKRRGPIGILKSRPGMMHQFEEY
jgi:hypothetical protein